MFVKVRNEKGAEGFGFLIAPISPLKQYCDKVSEVIDHIMRRVKSAGRNLIRKSDTAMSLENDHSESQRHQREDTPLKFMGFIEKTEKEFRIVSSTDKSVWEVNSVVQVEKVKLSIKYQDLRPYTA